LRSQAGEVVNVTPELMLAVTSGCALVEPWLPEFPPPEVLVKLTEAGEEALIESARRRAAKKGKKR
jgi:hypothetical protein